LGHAFADTATDAALLIGDRAINPPPDGIVAQWDLGDEWCRWAELPFVFAMWTARPGFDRPEIAAALEAARDRGLENLPDIAAREAASVGLTTDACLGYLRDNLYFYLGPRERQGLTLFHRHTVRMGLAPPAALEETLLAGVAETPGSAGRRT